MLASAYGGTMNYSKWIVAAAFAVPMVTVTAYAQEDKEETHQHETVKMEDLPAAVKTTVQREAKGKKIESIEKETKNGKTIYEVELVSNGKGQEIEISATGKVLERHAKRSEKGGMEPGEKSY